MGLIDLKTNLKSLKYGKDTIGGGYSGQPYIQTPIPDSFNDLVPDEDFILRGGANAARDAATDVKRLTKMFIDTKSPNGILFIAKQNLLSQTAVRTQTTDGVNVADEANINEFYQNAESKITRAIQKRIEEMSEEVKIKPIKVKCVSCENAFDMSIDFNYSSFFEAGF